MTVLLKIEGGQGGVEISTLREKTQILLEYLGKGNGELSILLTDDPGISSLNERYLKKKGPTNVISFGMGKPIDGGPDIMGDIALSIDTARRQADIRGVSLTDELLILITHGLLHLVGYIHAPEEGASLNDISIMEDREKELLSLIGIDL